MIFGSTQAADFVEAYGALDREFLKSLLAPARDDPWEGRAIFVGGRGGGSPRIAERRHVRRGRGPLFAKYEALLARVGLGANIEGGGGQTQHLIWPADATPPLQHVKSKSLQLEDMGIPGASARTVPISVHFRDIPEWTQNDGAVRLFVLHRFPHLSDANPKVRRRCRNRAARTVAILYCWFRVLLPAETIAEELGQTPEEIINAATHIRTHGEKFFNGERCGCKNWGTRNQYGKTKRSRQNLQ